MQDISHDPIHPRFGTQQGLHGAPLAFQFALLPGGEVGRLGFKPLIHPLLRTQPLIDVTGFVHQIQHHLVFDAFAVLVGVDPAAEHLQAGGLVLLEQGRAGEADEHGLGQQRFHHAMQLATLGAVALIHEDEQLPHCRAGLGLDLFEIGLKVVDIAHAELVHQGAEQPGCGLVQGLHQLSATAAALDGFTRSTEHSFDLLVELIAVGDDHHAGIGVVGQNPTGQQHHHDALAAALGVPDDAAAALLHKLLGGLNAEILVDTGQLLAAAIKEHEIAHQLDQSVLAADLE